MHCLGAGIGIDRFVRGILESCGCLLQCELNSVLSRVVSESSEQQSIERHDTLSSQLRRKRRLQQCASRDTEEKLSSPIDNTVVAADTSQIDTAAAAVEVVAAAEADNNPSAAAESGIPSTATSFLLPHPDSPSSAAAAASHRTPSHPAHIHLPFPAAAADRIPTRSTAFEVLLVDSAGVSRRVD